MRGTQLVQFHPSEPRFIPADAGNTSSLFAACCLSAVYPRWRGEHRERLRSQCVLYGLSPLARGTPGANCSHPRNRRFIPAGAGNTRASHRRQRAPPVYPRWRGEHGSMVADNRSTFGLSPLARGTRCQSLPTPGRRRFIPAGAGNTSRCRSCSGSGPVYPRWRGEHHRYPIVIRPAPGLSPLARGTRAL